MAHTKQKAESRRVFLKILQNVKFLARQGIALCAHYDAESNFMQLFKLRALDNPELGAWLERTGDKYLSPVIQNKMLELNVYEHFALDREGAANS